VRIVLGLALVAYALQDGLAIEGWRWAGLLGLVPLATAFSGVARFMPLWAFQAVRSANRSTASQMRDQ
jgi:hypothetical protein